MEEINHLTLHYFKLARLWRKASIWLDIQLPTGVDCYGHILKFEELLKGKMGSKRVELYVGEYVGVFGSLI